MSPRDAMLASRAALLALLTVLPAIPARAADPLVEAEVARRAGHAERAVALLEPLAADRNVPGPSRQAIRILR